MRDANTRGTAVWIHRVLATVFCAFDRDAARCRDSAEHRVTPEPSLT
jgi:hypothetical protein